jgi:hypothetical protein
MISQEQVVHLIKRKNKLKAQRGTWESHWQDLTNFVLPNEADFNTSRSKGARRTTLVYDSTGIHANEMLAAGLHGMLTNPMSLFRLIYTNTILRFARLVRRACLSVSRQPAKVSAFALFTLTR